MDSKPRIKDFHRLNTAGEFIKSFNSSETKSLATRIEDQTYIRHYSALLGTRTKLKIMNRMPVYDANVRVHLVKFKDYGKITTIKDLLKEIQYQTSEIGLDKKSEEYVERIQTSDRKDFKPTDLDLKFSSQISTDLKINITQLESFQKNCIVLKSWKRTIESGSHW